MNWKKRHRSFYYKYADDPEDIVLKSNETAHLIIDVQKTYLEAKENPKENEEWQPFFKRMKDLVIPNIKSLISFTRKRNIENIFARIACHKESGLDRSLSQKKPGFNYLLLPKDTPSGQIVDELKPDKDDIVVMKTTDSALTGTNLRLILRNMGIKNVICTGIFTDQCVSSTVRSLVDESFNVIVVEDCCAAATDDLHKHELEIINMIYCHVVNLEELKEFIKD
ncbi:MAG: Peroxyureidoacrylate/ureidoacrylate amidohydrolase RutB [Alphaproteobacteria bacterium MarineAlpha5_Bin11]|nr:MAG: Peroxyureidoacrylate/ureidoacrylate amidohydrolase RutB [Alphaproteobacteria bacterium MarineAlpha5_Bin11]PPR51711.1 MAG: Peroxyureidoacrylate/ureidoacrylate amidohydrolase RutB [Alphaproteobacteria bacterium MarineAlpha5_Bin10]|tara:strand:+ start:219 stop:890 length:672 start_codon:yes stop_codon:yes gene_type:complete